ncbi:hypothetical protein SAMN04489732_102437 [Amycolatopsis saalfeldensis]|uniref:4-amino-4-deoxy-L-arabinose transferase n=1 Tax=Amycolatopsis saalfeldensis TaxID=394193 RepID=A0A1H8T6L4_9PSEU|nr:hypothetical protein SAMN04489732_102437 [Amycolatopsis saalfeldensis]
MLSTDTVPRTSEDRPDRRRWVLPAVVAVLSAGAFALFRPHLIDDTFITLSYARNLAFHGHWGLIELGTSNTATSPLSVLVLGALTFVVRDAVLAAGILYVLCQVVIAAGLRRVGDRAGLPSWFSPLAVVLLTVNPLLISSIGLEVEFGAAAVVALLVFAVERRPVLLGVAAGALVLIRVDLVLLALVIFLLRKRFWAGMGKSVLAALVVAVPWFAFSWVVLGSAVPDTLIIKTLQKSWGAYDFSNGPVLYAGDFPWATWLSFLPAALGAPAFLGWLATLARRGPASAALLPFGALVPAGAVHYLAYSRLHVPPYHWYYGPSIVATTIFLAAAIAALAGRAPVLARRAGGIPAALAAAALVVASAGNYVSTGLPRAFAPIMSNHTTTAQYEQIGAELGRLVGRGTVRSGGEIGVLAYSCGCSIVDLFDDRGAVGPAIEQRKATTSALGRKLIDLNFEHFDFRVPPIKPEFALTPTGVGQPAPLNPLAHWRIASPWAGTQELYLVRADGA